MATTDTEIVRVLRILEYVGPRNWVEHTLSTGGVPARGEHRVNDVTPKVIRSGIVGNFPEVVEDGNN